MAVALTGAAESVNRVHRESAALLFPRHSPAICVPSMGSGPKPQGGTMHASPSGTRTRAMAAVLGGLGLVASGCSGMDDRAGLSCIDDSPACVELAIGRHEADSVPKALKGPEGKTMSPAQVSRTTMLAAEVAKELAAEMRARRCKA